MNRLLLILMACLVVAMTACREPLQEETASEGRAGLRNNGKGANVSQQFPDVIDVKVIAAGDRLWRFDVAIFSPYDSQERYADAWRILDAKDNELGIRILTHHHANEQPFTRSKTFKLPNGIEQVYVEGRDTANGWSGQRFKVNVPSS